MNVWHRQTTQHGIKCSFALCVCVCVDFQSLLHFNFRENLILHLCEVESGKQTGRQIHIQPQLPTFKMLDVSFPMISPSPARNSKLLKRRTVNERPILRFGVQTSSNDKVIQIRLPTITCAYSVRFNNAKYHVYLYCLWMWYHPPTHPRTGFIHISQLLPLYFVFNFNWICKRTPNIAHATPKMWLSFGIG